MGDEAGWSTEPSIEELAITSDGILMARHGGEVGMGWFGSAQDFFTNWGTLVAVAELTPDEMARVQELISTKVTDWRRPS